jgi:hypothetical protein
MTAMEGTETMHNDAALKMLEGRFSHHIKRFNHLPNVSDDDSDAQYDLTRESVKLARIALERAPKVQPTGNRVALLLSTDLGNVYRAVRRNLLPAELARWEEIITELDALSDKYES